MQRTRKLEKSKRKTERVDPMKELRELKEEQLRTASGAGWSSEYVDPGGC